MKTPKLSKAHRDSINLFANIVHGIKTNYLQEYVEQKNLGVPEKIRAEFAMIAMDELTRRAGVAEAFVASGKSTP
jgi:hypothetical protein